jgi:cytidyltransferase-like protein
MKACAIIAEFNPFHNGHQYLLKQAREITGADIIIIIMSGNFVQRGEPALINKWERARIALEYGADLIVEMPTEYAVDSAREFAHAGVEIAKLLKANQLAFGSETPDLNFEVESQILDRQFQDKKKYNQNFASQLFSETNISKSNDILGINYAYWKQKLNYELELIPIQRLQAEHLDQEVQGSIASASAIRRALLAQKDDFQRAVPEVTKQVLTATKIVTWEDYWQFLEYRLKTTSASELRTIRGITEGFENRILDNVNKVDNFTEFMKRLKTKRYTFTNIQRKLVNILLDFKSQSFEITKVRMLATNTVGRQYLRESELQEHLMTKIFKEDFETNYKFTKRADEVYQMVSPYQWGNAPIVKKNVKE